jgi:hypothetical protein
MAKAKFDIKTEATRTLYAGAGVTDLAVAAVREYVAEVQKKLAGVQTDVQKRVEGIDLEPKALRDQAVTVVNARVEALAKDAKARRAAIEARVAELQAEAKAYPAKVQALVNENVAVAGDTYGDLVKRGETLVARVRRQEATKATAASAKKSTAKAKTTTTQAKKATKSTAKKTTSTAKKTAAKKSAPAKSSAKATATTAKETAANAAEATTDAAAKVGD